MGTWGPDAFDNDHACDFAQDIEDSDDLSLVEQAIEKIIAAGKEEAIDSPDAEEALVAAEVVARLQGRSGARNAYTEGIDAWAAARKERPSPSLVAMAVVAIDRILTPPSELLELWEDSGEGEAWKASVADLRARVKG